MARRSSQVVDWANLFHEWRGSGLTQPEFCRSRGVPLHTFRRRLYRPAAELAAGGTPLSPPPTGDRSTAFLPVRVVEDIGPRSDSARPPMPAGAVEILLGGERRILVPPGFDAETLLRVVAVLEPPRC